MATIVDMPEYKTITQAKAHLNEIVDALQKEGEPVIVTRRGVPAALIMGWDEWEGLLETFALMKTPGAVDEIVAAERRITAGDYATIEDLRADLLARRKAAQEE